ncbi:MAG: LysR family transcriptional regulator [Eggerthellales bacterium]|nr:LysR family transcriptional regulator [Eggerthellales bacterium]
MTLQQLRYLLEVAQCGSFNAAAQQLFVSQSTLSVAIKELEEELGVEVFLRSNRGLTLTNDGTELLGYARQVLEQADLLQNRYSRTNRAVHNRLSVSTQHYAFCVHAFVTLVEEHDEDAYNFTLRETRTSEIIDDVREFRSEIGVLYESSFNERIMTRCLEEANLQFTPLFKARVHVFVGAQHPLADKDILTLDDLEDYPRYSFEQGTSNSFFFAEEPYGSLPHKRNITYSDRGTLTNLLTSGSGYTLSTGVLSQEMQSGIVAIPLQSNETMTVGYVTHNERKLSTLAQRYIQLLKEIISADETVSLLS